MKIVKNNYPNINLLYHNCDPYEHGVVEISGNNIGEINNLFGFVHAENTNDPNRLYIKIQNAVAGSKLADQKGGVPLKEFIGFLQDLYEEEMKVRKLTE